METPRAVVLDSGVPTDVVMVGAVVPGLVIVTNTCADCPHASDTEVGESTIVGGGVGLSSVPGVTVNIGLMLRPVASVTVNSTW